MAAALPPSSDPMALRFMPLEGLFLAGSVGRSIADRMGRFEASFLAERYMRHIPENTPIFLIRDDMAALHGCLAALTSKPGKPEKVRRVAVLLAN